MSTEWVRRTAVASVLLVALVAAIVSYCHMAHLAEESGEEWRSRLIPLSVDGMLVASTLAIVVRRAGGLRATWVPWLGLTMGILASLAANVAAARPDPISRIIAAWPPVALALSIETMVIVLREPAGKIVRNSGPKFGIEVQSETPAPSPVEVVPAPSKPKRTIVAPGSDKSSAESRARALVAENPTIGRRALMAGSGLKEYDARKLLEQARAEAPRNGHRVLTEAK